MTISLRSNGTFWSDGFLSSHSWVNIWLFIDNMTCLGNFLWIGWKITKFDLSIFNESLFAHSQVRTLLFAIQVLWQYLWGQMVPSDLMVSFLLITLLPDLELVLLQEIKKLINLESANFKLDPELSPLNDHTLIPCRTINIFFFISFRDLTSLKKMKTPKWIEKKSMRMGVKKEERENGNVNRHTTEQPSKKRKEDLLESKSEVKNQWLLT